MGLLYKAPLAENKTSEGKNDYAFRNVFSWLKYHKKIICLWTSFI